MRYWLVKSEPDMFGWDHQVKAGIEPWTGVRNHQAKLNLKAMKIGDRAFFYHSNIGKEIVGVVEVVREAYPDPTVKPDDPKGDWVCVDMKTVASFPRSVSLADIRQQPRLAGMSLLNSARLSVQPVTEAEWKLICKLGGYA